MSSFHSKACRGFLTECNICGLSEVCLLAKTTQKTSSPAISAALSVRTGCGTLAGPCLALSIGQDQKTWTHLVGGFIDPEVVQLFSQCNFLYLAMLPVLGEL